MIEFLMILYLALFIIPVSTAKYWQGQCEKADAANKALQQENAALNQIILDSKTKE